MPVDPLHLTFGSLNLSAPKPAPALLNLPSELIDEILCWCCAFEEDQNDRLEELASFDYIEDWTAPPIGIRKSHEHRMDNCYALMRVCRLWHTLTLRHFGSLIPIFTTRALMLYTMMAVEPSKVAAYQGYTHCKFGTYLHYLDLSFYTGAAPDLWMSLRTLGLVSTALVGMKLGFEAGRMLLHESTVEEHITKEDRLPDLSTLWPKLRMLHHLQGFDLDEVPYFHKSVLPRLFNLTEMSLVTPDADLLNAMTETFAKRRRLDSLFPNLFRPLQRLSLGSLYISSVDQVQHDAIPKLLAETPGLKSFEIVQFIDNAPSLADEWLLTLLRVLPDKLENLTLLIDRAVSYGPNKARPAPVYSGLLRKFKNMQSFDLPQTLVDENLFLIILHRTPEERYALQSITLRTDQCWTRVVLPSVAFHAVGQSSILKGAQMISSACVNGDCDFEDILVIVDQALKQY